MQPQLPEEKVGLKLSENIKKSRSAKYLIMKKKKLNQTLSKAEKRALLKTEKSLEMLLGEFHTGKCKTIFTLISNGILFSFFSFLDFSA